MVRIKFNDLKINNISSVSGVFTGENLEIRWKSFSTMNEGYGEINGDNNKIMKSENRIWQPRPKEKK